MSLRSWWQSWLGEDRPVPPAILTEAEAIERVRAYAAEHGYQFKQPMNLKLKRQLRDHQHPENGSRYVYLMALGTDRPMPFVEVDATDGTVLAWRSLPR